MRRYDMCDRKRRSCSYVTFLVNRRYFLDILSTHIELFRQTAPGLSGNCCIDFGAYLIFSTGEML
jgi:hypothetical protein